MLVLHPDLRQGLAEERLRRLAEDMGHRDGPGVARRMASRLLPAGRRRDQRGPACLHDRWHAA